jgi:putative thioredoxin
MLQDVGTATATADTFVKDTTTQTFMKDVIEESKRQPVLVDFWAEWCGPCKQLGPVLEKVVRSAKGKIKLVKMDIDKRQVVAFIERVTKGKIGSEEKDLLAAADAALGKGDAAAAADLYAQVLAEDGGNIAALAGLARAYVKTGAIEQAKQTLDMVPEAKRNDAAVAAARSAIDLAEQAKSVGPIGELEAKVAANPLDHQARFDLAVALNGKNRRQEAVDHLLEIVRRDRKWNDDGARRQLVQFFEAWGGTDEATVNGRKRLSSILFA